MGKLIPKPLTVKTSKVTVRENGKIYIGYGKDYLDALKGIQTAIDNDRKRGGAK